MLLFVVSTFQDTSFEVLSVERKTKPIFRMGCEVVDTLVIRRDVMRYTITLSKQHTMCGPVKLYAKGDRIDIKKAIIHDGDTIDRGLIRTVK
jgi:hypothetical protein